MRNKAFITTLFFLAVLFLAAIPAAYAADLPPQLTQPPDKLAEQYLADIAARVPLTPGEKAVLRPILVAQTKKRQEITRARLVITPGLAGVLALREDMRELAEETDSLMAAALPPEKMRALRDYREKRLQQLQAKAQVVNRHN